MEKRLFGKTCFKISPLGLGTWVFGGWPWNEVSEAECEKTIEKALSLGINLIDTAPFYGFGRAEEIVGQTLKRLKKREEVVLATKAGLCWEKGKKKKAWRDVSKKNILREIDESLKRLQTEWIDIYQIHWPDEKTEIGETMEAMFELKECGKIKVIGVSNFSAEQMRECLKYAPLESLQAPYNYFQREIEKEILPFCIENNIGVLSYGTLRKGLLTGKFNLENRPNDPVRQPAWDPMFAPENYSKCLKEIEELKIKADEKNIPLAQWVIEWTLEQPGITCALAGARNASQLTHL
ncbi:MAG: aldo/keto reductase [Deltaproteobacteria bacterium]|nr:aldo/keto reductase [Deltaproteobacteria bacterium]